MDAAWGKLDVTWNDTWRLAAGARWEDFSQLSVPIDQYEFDTDMGKIPVTRCDSSRRSPPTTTTTTRRRR